MRRAKRTGAGAAALLAAMLLAATVRLAAADPLHVRIVVPSDVAALSLVVAAQGHLIEQQAASRGLGQTTIEWLSPGTGNPIDELIAGQADIVATTDLVGFMLAWDQRSGTPQEIRALAALARTPYQLLTRNPAIGTIVDFSAKDRIAVPAPKVSLPAVLLEMAAAEEWGPAHYDKLDPLLVPRSSEAADAALHSAKGDVDSDFARMPYADDERGDRAVRRIMDSFDIAGPHSVGAIVATAAFRDANPALCAAVVAALGEAEGSIRQGRGAAAETYDSWIKSDTIPVEQLTDMLGDPDTSFTPNPAGLQRLAAFLHKIGRLKHSPDSWQQMFFPEIYKQPGS